MTDAPVFPHFKQLELEDRESISEMLWAYQPETSELTFTNLFIWRKHYAVQWSLWRDTLLFLCTHADGSLFCLPPVGPSAGMEAVHLLLAWLREEKKQPQPCIVRADGRLAAELAASPDFIIEPQREHYDYVYATGDLVQLAGRKYHGKKNHVNKFRSDYNFAYEVLTAGHIEACLQLQDAWCDCNRCSEDMNLMGEWEAIREILGSCDRLSVQGGVIVIDGAVEAFTLGELLNKDTAVVHIEKANARIPGLYAVMNQQFCEHAWSGTAFVNREQDLGDEGLRQAKLSYHPVRLVEKFKIRLAEHS
ncbi:MAG: DUF2156 domain-containing protein [Deltaproteobacteria bacterium]|nr:DUF2156 domain-containing protein [Deltaproteobacteria bacterium]